MANETSLLRLVEQRHVGTLATLKRDGRPQLSNVSYCLSREPDMVRMSLTDTRAKVKNLRRDGRASFVVSSPDGWSYTVLEGAVDLSPVAADPGDDVVEELIDVYRRIAGEHPDWQEYRDAMVADERLVGRLTWQHTYGMARG